MTAAARVIPCLLLSRAGLVKTVRFRAPRYLGDPINIARLFSDKEVDELVLLDIDATVRNAPIQFDLVAEIASECFMPIAYGGGIRSLADAERCFELGVEKVVVNAAAIENPRLIQDIADAAGSQSVIVSIDAQKSWWGTYEVRTHGARRRAGVHPVAHAVAMQQRGAGEILLTAVDRDGTMSGYDLDLIRQVAAAVDIPVIASGGAGSVADLAAVLDGTGASAAAAGSLFVFHGPHRAVLINYPDRRQVSQLCGAKA